MRFEPVKIAIKNRPDLLIEAAFYALKFKLNFAVFQGAIANAYYVYSVR